MKKMKVIALVAALILALCVYAYLGELNEPHEEPRTNVVVCLVDIPENTTITADMVEVRSVLAESVLPNAVTDINAVVGMVMNSDMFAGEQILASRLVRMGDADTTSDSLSYIVEPGMRAVTIAVTQTSGLANLLRPGNMVDVIMYYELPEETEPTEAPAEGEEPEEEVEETEPVMIPHAGYLMQNIKILAVDQTLRRGAADVDGYVTVTLMVTPEQALDVSFMEQFYAVRLVLRSNLDEEEVIIEDVLLDTILGIEED